MKFEIYSWNVIMTNNNPNDRRPSVYIKPSKELENILNSLPNNEIDIMIKGTYSAYDSILITAHFYSSANMPNYRPNFFMDTKYLILVLDVEWSGYPPAGTPLGFVEI